MLPLVLFAQATTIDLVRLIPDGLNVVGVIVVVVLFLNQQNKFNIVLNNLTTQTQTRAAESQKLYQDQLKAITDQALASQKAFQEQVQLLMDQNLRVAQESIKALKTVEGLVREMNARLTTKLPGEK